MSNQPISDQDTPDPWMVAANGLFYLTFTLGNRIEIWSSPYMESFHSNAPHLCKSVVWQPTPGSPWSADIWAPELHWLDGRWYIYTCGAPPDQGNRGHRTTILRCAAGCVDPMRSECWEFLGPLRGMRGDQWSIDATVFYAPRQYTTPGGQRTVDWGLYICYSGWPIGDNSDTQQDLFLVKMNSPEEAVESTLVCISRAELPWERPDHGRRGVNEGPTWIDLSPAGGFRGIVYSAHGSWTSDYKLAVLELVGDEPLDARSWQKRSTPLLVSDKAMGGPFGPGHASFVKMPDGMYANQSGSAGSGCVFCVYHGTENEGEGWANRKGRVIMMTADCLRSNAKTMCCAYKGNAFPELGGVPGTWHGGAASHVNPNGGGYPGQQQQQQLQQPAQSQQPAGKLQGGSGSGAKIVGEIEKRIPAQYRSVFDKAKKFLG